MTKEKDVQHQIAPDLEQDVVIEHPIRDHYSPRSTPRSQRCRSVGTARSVSQVRGPPPGQWDIHTGLWDPYVGNITRHGPDEAALRALSEGRFVGIICAKSVAESVCLAPKF